LSFQFKESVSVRFEENIPLDFSTRAARVPLLSVVSVCPSVNTIATEQSVRGIITIFSGHHPMVEKEAKFKNGYIAVRGW